MTEPTHSYFETWWQRVIIGASNWNTTMNALIFRGNNIRTVEAIADLNNIPQGFETNALAHALTSAWSTLAFGAAPTREVGYGKEIETYRNDVLTGKQWDSFKDLWNNNIGRQIGEFAKQNGLTTAQVTDLVLDAYFSGYLIVNKNDQRIDQSYSSWP